MLAHPMLAPPSIVFRVAEERDDCSILDVQSWHAHSITSQHDGVTDGLFNPSLIQSAFWLESAAHHKGNYPSTSRSPYTQPRRPTPAERVSAAIKIQVAYRLHLSRRAKLEELVALEEAFDELFPSIAEASTNRPSKDSNKSLLMFDLALNEVEDQVRLFQHEVAEIIEDGDYVVQRSGRRFLARLRKEIARLEGCKAGLLIRKRQSVGKVLDFPEDCFRKSSKQPKAFPPLHKPARRPAYRRRLALHPSLPTIQE